MTHVTPGLLVLTISLLVNLLHGVDSNQIPSDKVPQVAKNAIPKHIKAMYKADKAIYAKDYGYKLISIPNKPPPPVPAATTAGPESRSSRVGRQAWNTHYPQGPPPRLRKRKVRPPPVRMTYTMPAPYAAKYKSYAPTYKKRPRYAPGPPRGRYPPKYRMPLHSNVIEPMEDYEDEEVMEEEPVVMETMGHSYPGAAMSMMRPAHNDEIYMSDYDDMSPMRLPSRPVEYVADDDYMMRQPDYYSGGAGSYRGRGAQTRAVKPVSLVYSSRYRDMRNSESRYDPELAPRRPMKQMEYASSPQYVSSPPMYSEPEPKYRPYQIEPEPKYRSFSEPEHKYRSFSEPEHKFRSNVDDSDFLSSNLRVKSELPDFMRSGNSPETPDSSGVEVFNRQPPTAQTNVDSGKWTGSLKFMPRPFASTQEAGKSNPIRSVSTKDSGSNHATYNKGYEAPSSHTKQSALTIHDLLLQQAKQIQDSQSAAQARDLSDDYSRLNDFLVYSGPSSGQRFRSEAAAITRRSSGSEKAPQFHRYTRPAATDLDDMDAVLDSLPWKVKKK